MSLFKEKFKDSTPFIPGAGVETNSSPYTADYSIRQDLYYQPNTITPDNIKKYRDSTHQRIGVKQLHPGIYDDPKFYEELTHGMKSKSSDHVPDCIKGANIDGNKFFMNQLAESHYASNKREPLGKSLIRNYKYPEEIKNNNNFRFGIPTKGIINAKELIYNGGPLKEDDNTKKLYYKTHGVTDPGEQSNRGFKFNFDPNDHKFGYYQEKEIDGVKKSLRNDYLYNPYPQTKLVGKRLEDYREATEDMLGKSKFLGTLAPKYYDDNHTFGKSSNFEDWNASKCIHGDQNIINNNNISPDIDLGRDVHYKNKIKNLQPSKRDLERTYGIPSIRNDLPKKELKSVSDIKNYGDEPDAYELLYPHPEHNLGIDDKDFEELMTKEEIYELIKKYDFNIPEEEFNLIYQVGLKNYPNNEEKMSPKSFIGTMRNLKREYQKYRNIVNNPC